MKLFNYPKTPKDETLLFMLKIVLASRSPRRRKLLSQIGLEFEVHPSTNEEIISSDNPIEVVLDLAEQKAEEVAIKFSNSLTIGADTIVVFNNKILGKPADQKEAFTMLKLLSNQEHLVYTGVSVFKTNDQSEIVFSKSFYEETKVTFSPLSDEEIDAYIATGSPLDKAGAYGIQDDWGSVFVKKINGDFYNVVGFPLNRFYRELKTLAPEIVNQIHLPVNS